MRTSLQLHAILVMPLYAPSVATIWPIGRTTVINADGKRITKPHFMFLRPDSKSFEIGIDPVHALDKLIGVSMR